MKVVLFGAHRWGREEVAKQFQELGNEVWLACSTKEEISQLPFSYLLYSNETDLADQFFKLFANEEVSILALDDMCLEIAANLSEKFGNNYLPQQAAKASTHKHLGRKLWNEYAKKNTKLYQTPYVLLEGEKILEQDASFFENDDPYFIKPNSYSGSIGVSKQKDKEPIPALSRSITSTLEAEASVPMMKGIPFSKRVIAELAIPRQKMGLSSEFSAHVLSVNGEHQLLGISEKWLHPNSYVELGHVFPSPHLEESWQRKIEKCCVDLLLEMKVQNCISNWEFIITPKNKLGLIEFQLRPSGDRLMDLITASLGTSPYQILAERRTAFTKGENLQAVLWASPKESIYKITKVVDERGKAKIDRAALMSANYWNGPSDWYDRYIEIQAEGKDKIALYKQANELANSIQLIGENEHGETVTTYLYLPQLTF